MSKETVSIGSLDTPLASQINNTSPPGRGARADCCNVTLNGAGQAAMNKNNWRPLQTENCHDTDFVVTGGDTICHYDNLWFQ